MEYFLVRYDSRVVIYERKMFIRLATGQFGASIVICDHRVLISKIALCFFLHWCMFMVSMKRK